MTKASNLLFRIANYRNGKMVYLLIHTMTITEREYVLQAQFFHAFGQIQEARLIGRRISLRIQPYGGRNKMNLQRLSLPGLKAMMKRNTGNIKHHLRTIKITSQNNFQSPMGANEDRNNLSSSPSHSNPINDRPTNGHIQDVNHQDTRQHQDQFFVPENLGEETTAAQTNAWLNQNRFEKYIPALSGYSGKDLLRMCKDDLIEICGHTADAIRLYNSVQNKVIIPRRTLYVSREQMNVFSAIYMSNYSSIDLLQKLSFFLGIQPDLVKDIHMVGPQSIRIQVENEVIMYMKDESMFHVSIAPETANTNCVIILLKPCNR